ncbi:hypothetical protein KC19_9G139300 [Ceratodon purpureus]|uniref:Uncharacterized protein n=1 Tax=Ceratodon purpureus TaxID=3225 RepID=A0A8T0GUV9_CERPU|nr:hypothetical protein KC19_9G139300 [Ceratodon purpureus]
MLAVPYRSSHRLVQFGWVAFTGGSELVVTRIQQSTRRNWNSWPTLYFLAPSTSSVENFSLILSHPSCVLRDSHFLKLVNIIVCLATPESQERCEMIFVW